ncbi:MAG: phage adaptor protein [Burkholderiales bacterium]
MSISNFGELKTAISNWSHRTDLTAILPDFVSLAEARIGNELDFREFESESNLIAIIGSRYIALPVSATLFIRPIELWLTTYVPRESVAYIGAYHMPVSVASGIPNFWTVDSGARLAFDTIADRAYTYTFRYVAKPALGSGEDGGTNWLLNSDPEIYLYGSLMEVALYTRDTDAFAMWTSNYQKAMNLLRQREHRAKSLEPLGVDLALQQGSIINRTGNTIFDG